MEEFSGIVSVLLTNKFHIMKYRLKTILVKIRVLISVFAIFLAISSSCLVRSIHPFYKEKNIEFLSGLTGTWIDQDSSIWEISRRENSESFLGKAKVFDNYHVVYKDGDGKEKDAYFILTHFKLKGVSYLDFEALTEENIGDNLASWHFIPSHSVARIEMFGNENALFYWYDEEWLADLFEKNRVKISHEKISSGNSFETESYILTASTDELQKFLVKYGDEIDIFKYLDMSALAKKPDAQSIFNYLNSSMEEPEKMDEPERSTGDLIYINMRKIED